jgi:hypothetical protein
LVVEAVGVDGAPLAPVGEPHGGLGGDGAEQGADLGPAGQRGDRPIVGQPLDAAGTGDAVDEAAQLHQALAGRCALQLDDGRRQAQRGQLLGGQPRVAQVVAVLGDAVAVDRLDRARHLCDL